MHDQPPQGSIDDIFLPRLVAGLHLHEFEGSLRLTLADSVKVLYFKRGEIASAASNADSDRLAHILIQEGRLTIEQLELARTRMEPGASLGKTLIEMGFLTPTELLQGARRQVQIIVASCFTATSGSYEMVPGPLPPEVTSLGLGTRRLLFDCLMRSGDRATIVREIGSMEAVYRPTDRLEFVLSSLKLESEIDRFARLLNGAASLHDLSSRTSHDDFTVGRIVLALDLLGGAEKVPPTGEAAPVAAGGRAIPIVVATPDADPAPAAEEGADDDTIEIETEGLEPVGDRPSPVPVAALVPVATLEESPSIPSVPVAARPIDPPAFEVTADESPVVAEPPPIPPDELPAFTQPPDAFPSEPAPPVAAVGEPRWEIDPDTGERVHTGPIVLTFDGRIAPSSGESKNVMRILLGASAVTLVVGGALGYVVLRNGDGEPAAASRSVPSRAVATLPVEAEPVQNARAAPPEPRPSAVPAVVPAPAEARMQEHAREAPAPSAVAKTEDARTAPPVARAAPPAVAQTAPVPAPTTAPARRGGSTGRTALASDPGIASAQQQLAQGDAAGAARQFESFILSGKADRFTLQVMIACQEDTVKGARTRAGADDSLFILPYSLKGKSCYRVCWGVYADVDSARAAASNVPAALTGSTVPLVVPLSRLRTPG